MKLCGRRAGSAGRPTAVPSLALLPLASSTQDTLTPGPPAKATVPRLDAKLCAVGQRPAELCTQHPGRSET